MAQVHLSQKSQLCLRTPLKKESHLKNGGSCISSILHSSHIEILIFERSLLRVPFVHGPARSGEGGGLWVSHFSAKQRNSFGKGEAFFCALGTGKWKFPLQHPPWRRLLEMLTLWPLEFQNRFWGEILLTLNLIRNIPFGLQSLHFANRPYIIGNIA